MRGHNVTMHGLIVSLLFLACVSLSAQTPQSAKEEALAVAKKYPGLRVQASVGTRTKPVPGSSYMKTMTISPAVVIESAQTQPMAATTKSTAASSQPAPCAFVIGSLSASTAAS